jgi:hypothetical protein
VDALEADGVSIRGAYLIRLVSEDGFADTAFRIVTDHDSRDVIFKVVRMRRDGRIPDLADHIKISPIRPGHVEASRVLEYAARIGVRQFVYFSTGSVYPLSPGPCHESDPVVPIGHYAATKAAAESLQFTLIGTDRSWVPFPGVEGRF